MHKLPENPFKLFTGAIQAMTKWANSGQDAENKPEFDWSLFTLDNLVGCFNVSDKDKFCTDEPLESYLDDLDKTDFSLHDIIPEGVRVTLAVVPCDINGLSFDNKYYDDSTNQIYPYFQIFYSNPTHNTGMALGWGGGVKAAPYLKVIPEEILLQCSFVVEYHPGENRKQDETDYEYFTRMMSEKYRRLQELIKGRM